MITQQKLDIKLRGIRDYLNNKEVRTLIEIRETFKGSAFIYRWLVNNHIIYKENGIYKWDKNQFPMSDNLSSLSLCLRDDIDKDNEKRRIKDINNKQITVSDTDDHRSNFEIGAMGVCILLIMFIIYSVFFG